MILRIVGNSSSPHLRSWVRILKTKFDLIVYDINRSTQPIIDDVNIPIVKPVSWSQFQGLKVLQYIILGIWLRIQNFDDTIHAHNTSGFGLSALISGKKYIITTYGTEIYAASSKGRIFRWVVNKVLHKSLLITASTPYMANFLENEFGINNEKIFCNHLVDEIYLNQKEYSKELGPRTWFVNRRMTKLYCTIEVVTAFKAFVKLGGKGRLALLEGDSDPLYAQNVIDAVDAHSCIHIIRGTIDQSEMIRQLNSAHFSISVPESDQLSSAILEAASCFAVPIIRDLPCYEPVKDICIVADNNGNFIESMTQSFLYTASLSDEDLREMGVHARYVVADRFSPSEFIENFSYRIREAC